jgi:glycosyltransferase involved in cell wall biosynthesis
MGGGEVALSNLVVSLLDTPFHPVVILGSDGPLRLKLQSAGVETHLLPLNQRVASTSKDSLGLASLLRIGTALHACAYTLRLARFLRRFRPDLVHTNSLKADLCGGIAARLAGLPVIWHVRDRIADDYLPAPVARIFRWLCRRVPVAVLANSNATLETLQLARRDRSTIVYSGVAPTFINVVHDGTYEQQIAPAEVETGVKPPRIGLVGRISPWKGQDVFIRAAARVLQYAPNAQFQIIGSCLFGEEDYERKVRALVKELGLEDSVHFLGFREDVPALIQKMDVLVHASTVGEPFGQVIIEGMAAGKPVVATNGGGVPEIVVEGETGLLVPMGESTPMADAILRLIRDPERAKAMGAAGVARVKNHFTIQHTVDKITTLYREVLHTSEDTQWACPMCSCAFDTSQGVCKECGHLTT